MKKAILCLFLSSYFIIPVTSQAQDNRHPKKKYNVLFIAVDDLSIAFDAYGNPDAPAPNFARLMQHGMMFKTTYCQYPICSPSRTSLFSGKRPDSTGILTNAPPIRTKLGKNFKFIPEYFNEFGYRTETYGKVGPCGHEDEISWDYDFNGHFGANLTGYGETPAWWIDTAYDDASETKYGVITDSVVEKLKHPVSTPYFYGMALSTHNPFTPLLESWNKIGDPNPRNKDLLPVDEYGTITNVKGNGSGTITLPNTPRNDTKDIPPIALKPPQIYTPYETQQFRHAYYAEIAELDEHLGVLLDALDRQNLWDSTVVVFWSDHGLHMGEHNGQWLKLTLFEEALRVPFVICAPGKKADICERPVELVDIYPTLAELCNLPAPPDQEGVSLVPLLDNPKLEWKKAIFSQRLFEQHSSPKEMGRAVRTEKLHYNSWVPDGEELYDIVNDPHEYTNLANDPAHKDDLKKMRELLANGWEGALPPVNQTCNGRDNVPQPEITVVGNLNICNAGSVLLKTDYYPKAIYQWKKDGDKIPGATSRKYIATKEGNYKVEVGYMDCGNKSDKVTVTNSCSKIAGKLSSSELLTPGSAFSLYPNPSTGIVTVTYISTSAGSIDLKIYNGIGEVVFSKTDKAITGSNNYELNLSALKAGIYDVKLNNGISPQRTKLVIER